jgi:hypothetical protein
MKGIALSEASQVSTACSSDRSNMKVETLAGEGQWSFDLLVNIACIVCKNRLMI